MNGASPGEEMDSDQWCSPREISEPLEQFFGGPVGVDPCSNERSIIKSLVAFTFGGLHLPWRSRLRSSYMNNPYSCNVPWAMKAVHEMDVVHHIDEQVTLMMVAPSTDWWSTLCNAKRNPRMIFTPRLKFIGDKKYGARFDTVIKYFGRRHRAFEREFKHVTRWLAWGR